jgi:hypothetical protein
MGDMTAITEAQGRIWRGDLVELKVDGTRMTYKNGVLTSDRDINRNERYPHILQEVKMLNWRVRGEIALEGGNILQLNKSENWHRAKYYIFDLFEINGRPTAGMTAAAIRELIVQTISAAAFRHLTFPKSFSSFDEGWRHVVENDAEGLVLKERNGTCYKVKKLKEEKLRIVGHEAGKLKGKFLIERNGVTCGVSGTSVGFIDLYHRLVREGKVPYAEIEFPFLTEDGLPFQPRLRRIGTKEDLKYT